MNIDFTKLLQMLLPTFLRAGLTELITALGSVLGGLYSGFRTWQTDMRLQAAMTCQVMYLEAILNYRLLNTFNRIITISDGDGVTVDFVVNQPNGVTVDTYRMIALLDKYKTYGKRYTIAQHQYTYDTLWSDFVCEMSNLKLFSATWSDFVCEQSILEFIYFRHKIGSSGYSVWIECDQAPGVEVTIETMVSLVGGGTYSTRFTIAANSTVSNSTGFATKIDTVTITNITPYDDGAGTSFWNGDYA